MILAIFGACFLINNLICIVKDVIFKKNDTQIAASLIDKLPIVNSDFYKKSYKEQAAENNQEIHEVNKRLEILETNYKYISEQLKQIMGELKK